jgi:hypothetical protein
MMPTDWSNAPKDPDAVRDYTMSWADDIGDATITAHIYTVAAGTVVLQDTSFTDNSTTVRVAGGTAGELAQIKNHVFLSTGEEDEYTSPLPIIER